MLYLIFLILRRLVLPDSRDNADPGFLGHSLHTTLRSQQQPDSSCIFLYLDWTGRYYPCVKTTYAVVKRVRMPVSALPCILRVSCCLPGTVQEQMSRSHSMQRGELQANVSWGK